MTDARGLKIKPGDCVIHVQIDYNIPGHLRFTNGTIEKIQSGTAEALKDLINFRLKGVKK